MYVCVVVCLNVIVFACAFKGVSFQAPSPFLRGTLHRSWFLSHSANFKGMYSALTVT